jgi:hypothetical protein
MCPNSRRGTFFENLSQRNQGQALQEIMGANYLKTKIGIFRFASWKLAHMKNNYKKYIRIERDVIHITTTRLSIGCAGG